MALTGALLAAQIAAGGVQALSGMASAAGLDRPEYEIPPEIEANMTQAERLAFQGLPDAQKKEFIQRMERQMATSLSNLSDRRAGIGSIAALSQQAQDQNLKLLSADSQQRISNINTLMNMRDRYAQYSDKKFMINQMEPYQEALQASREMTSAGIQNITSGITGIASIQNAKSTAEAAKEIAKMTNESAIQQAKSTAEQAKDISSSALLQQILSSNSLTQEYLNLSNINETNNSSFNVPSLDVNSFQSLLEALMGDYSMIPGND